MLEFRKTTHILLLIAMTCASLGLKAQINTEQVMNIGRNALFFEDYILSIQYFNQVIKAKPYMAEPYFYRSVAKIDLEDYKGAETDATLCIERNPFIVDAYQVRGVARQNQRKFKEAITDYDKGLSMRPDNKIFLMNRAICLLEIKEYDKEAPLDENIEYSPETVGISLISHVGAGAIPIVAPQDKVKKGDLIAKIPEEKLGASYHSSIDGTVESIDNGIIIIRRN